MARQLIWSLELSIKAADGDSVDEIGDLKKKLHEFKKKIGEPPTAQVIKKSAESMKNVVMDLLIPIANAWERSLIEFDELFYSRSVVIQFDGRRVEGENMATLLRSEAEGYLFPLLDGGTAAQKIELYCCPRGLRNANKDTGFNGGKFVVWFFDNAYEIESPEVALRFAKAYSQKLTDMEIEDLVEKIGTFLLDSIQGLMQHFALRMSLGNCYLW